MPIVDWLELANDAVLIQAAGVCCCRKSQNAGDSFRVAEGLADSVGVNHPQFCTGRSHGRNQYRSVLRPNHPKGVPNDV